MVAVIVNGDQVREFRYSKSRVQLTGQSVVFLAPMDVNFVALANGAEQSVSAVQLTYSYLRAYSYAGLWKLH